LHPYKGIFPVSVPKKGFSIDPINIMPFYPDFVKKVPLTVGNKQSQTSCSKPWSPVQRLFHLRFFANIGIGKSAIMA
jgi:hypothetical protein